MFETGVTGTAALGPALPLPHRGGQGTPIVLTRTPCPPGDANNFKDNFTGSWDSPVGPRSGFPPYGQPYPAAQSLNWQSKSFSFILETFQLVFFTALPDLLPHNIEQNKISQGLLEAPDSIVELLLGIILSLVFWVFVGRCDTVPAWDLRQGIFFSPI